MNKLKSSLHQYLWNGASILVFILSLLCGGMGLCGCDDELSTNPNDQPTLSVDTLHMGTLLAGNSSKTYHIKLYNRCSSELKLTSIVLRDASTSGFRMNVDGMNGTSFTQSEFLRIAEGDSMFIFVEATFPEKGTSGIARHTDYIDIFCNQRQQTIVLDAESKDVLKLYGEVLDQDVVWTPGMDIQVYDSLVIPQGVSLTLMDSVTLYLHDKADIRVRGTLVCAGKPGRPVAIRGDRTDNMFADLPYDNLPSQWGGMYIDSTAQGCRFVYTDIRGMAHGIEVDSADVVFDACHIKNSDSNLLTCHMTRLTMQNCLLSNASEALLDIYGGWYDITHCTLANYNFTSVVHSQALRLCNMDTASCRYTPLYECNLLNTLVWGRWQKTDVSLDYFQVALDTDSSGQTVYADSVFSYRFDHCLLKANGSDDENFVGTIWNKDPLYRSIDTHHYSFDFHLQNSSPAIGFGASEGAQRCPVDLDGVTRLSQPSIGCYEILTK